VRNYVHKAPRPRESERERYMGWERRPPPPPHAKLALCSPSPGTSGPLTTTSHPFFHNGSVSCLYCIHFLIANPSFSMKSVPGVMQFESNASLSGREPSLARIVAANFSASFDERNRRERCWFILARGATWGERFSGGASRYISKRGVLRFHRRKRLVSEKAPPPHNHQPSLTPSTARYKTFLG